MNLQLVDSIRSLIDALPKEERILVQQHLAKDRETASQTVDLNQFSGTIQLHQDPLIYQQQMRDEWA
jgi:hypothetical protein